MFRGFYLPSLHSVSLCAVQSYSILFNFYQWLSTDLSIHFFWNSLHIYFIQSTITFFKAFRLLLAFICIILQGELISIYYRIFCPRELLQMIKKLVSHISLCWWLDNPLSRGQKSTFLGDKKHLLARKLY